MFTFDRFFVSDKSNFRQSLQKSVLRIVVTARKQNLKQHKQKPKRSQNLPNHTLSGWKCKKQTFPFQNLSIPEQSSIPLNWKVLHSPSHFPISLNASPGRVIKMGKISTRFNWPQNPPPQNHKALYTGQVKSPRRKLKGKNIVCHYLKTFR